jgi:hypothetical protein
VDLASNCRMPNSKFPTKLVEGEHAFLVWKARSERFEVEDGADSLVIRGGRIIAQTIFYRLSKGSLDTSGKTTGAHNGLFGCE